jgi:hypothetical protein
MGSYGPWESAGCSFFQEAKLSVSMAEVVGSQDAGWSYCHCKGEADPGADHADIEYCEEEHVACYDGSGVWDVLRPEAMEYDGLVDALVDEIDTCSHIFYFLRQGYL